MCTFAFFKTKLHWLFLWCFNFYDVSLSERFAFRFWNCKHCFNCNSLWMKTAVFIVDKSLNYDYETNKIVWKSPLYLYRFSVWTNSECPMLLSTYWSIRNNRSNLCFTGLKLRKRKPLSVKLLPQILLNHDWLSRYEWNEKLSKLSKWLEARICEGYDKTHENNLIYSSNAPCHDHDVGAHFKIVRRTFRDFDAYLVCRLSVKLQPQRFFLMMDY